jgi:hypothetical protein
LTRSCADGGRLRVGGVGRWVFRKRTIQAFRLRPSAEWSPFMGEIPPIGVEGVI